MPPSRTAPAARPASPWGGALLGLLLGFAPGAALGVGRFAYALVLPEMQAALGIGYAGAGALGSANTAGYLLGALASHRALERVGYRRGVLAATLLNVPALALLAATDALWALAALRFAQGVLGALVFVGGAALLLASGGRGFATGMYFGGVGIGIVLSPLALPLMAGWRGGWLLLAALCALMALPPLLAARRLRDPPPRAPGDRPSLRPIAAPLVAYGLYGAGYIGYMTFVTSGLAVAMGPFWFVLGAGACLTAFAWGRITDALGGRRALPLVLATLALASLPPLVGVAPHLSGLLFGISFLGVITALTDAFRVFLPPPAWGRAMGLSTAAFAGGQALGPQLTGLAGELVGNAGGALWAATALLLLALAVALPSTLSTPRRPAR